MFEKKNAGPENCVPYGQSIECFQQKKQFQLWYNTVSRQPGQKCKELCCWWFFCSLWTRHKAPLVFLVCAEYLYQSGTYIRHAHCTIFALTSKYKNANYRMMMVWDFYSRVCMEHKNWQKKVLYCKKTFISRLCSILKMRSDKGRMYAMFLRTQSGNARQRGFCVKLRLSCSKFISRLRSDLLPKKSVTLYNLLVDMYCYIKMMHDCVCALLSTWS